MQNAHTTTVFPAIPVRLRLPLIALICCLLYINTTGNQYALDDVPIIRENSYVQKGFDGLGDIFTSDMFSSMFQQYGVEQQLSGGRYRPLSVATFAIEYQLFRQSPAVSHAINMLLYALLGMMIYVLFRGSFRLEEDICFISTLLFVIHPIHAEAVANLKSRDELLSLLFILLTLRYCFKFVSDNTGSNLVIACVLLFLALLSKEYAVLMFIIAPLSIWLFASSATKKQLIIISVALMTITVLYVLMRISVVGATVITQNDPLNNPYIFASGPQKIATKIFVLLKYLLLLFFPHPLSSDYSYATIAFRNLTDPLVWCSILIHVGLVIWAVYAVVKKQKIGLAIAWYLAFLLPVSNLIFDIGATMGERLIFHASLGFCLALAVGLKRLIDVSGTHQKAIFFFSALVLLATFKTIPRNRDWKNDDTLFLHDIHTVPNSMLVNNNAADALIRKADHIKDKKEQTALLHQAKQYTSKALTLDPRFVNALINNGLICFIQDSLDLAMNSWLRAKSILPNDPHLPRLSNHLMNLGLNIGRSDIPVAMNYFKKSIQLNEKNVGSWSNLGGAYHTVHQFDSALYCWKIALSLDPNDPIARAGYNALTH